MAEGGAIRVLVGGGAGGLGGGSGWLGGGGGGGGGLAADKFGAIVLGVVGGDDDRRFGGGVEAGGFGLLGWGEEATIAEPGAEGVVVRSGVSGGDVPGVFEVEGANGLAGALDGVDVAGLEGEGNGLCEVDAGVFEVAVDEEGDGDEAGSGGLGELPCPLVDADGAGDFLGRFDFVSLGAEGGAEGGEQECGETEEATDGGAGMHACECRRGSGCWVWFGAKRMLNVRSVPVVAV
jgi:hypothetical protein